MIINIIAFIFLIYQRIAMSLLQWLVLTSDSQQTNCQIKSSQLLHHIINLLIKIDPTFFAQILRYQNSDYCQTDIQNAILDRIDKYLCQHQQKKFRKEFINIIKQHSDWNELKYLVLFLSIHSQIKPEIIQQIDKLPNVEQKIIMESIQRIQDNCQTAFDFKKVIERMQKIQRNNENLRQQIIAQSDQLQTQQIRVNELKQDNFVLATNLQRYALQKKNAFEELHLYQLSQFIELCCLIKKQTQTNSETYNDLVNQNKKLQTKRKQLRKELLNFGATIVGQMEEVQKLKVLWQEANDQYLESEDLVIPKLALGDNTNRANIKSGRSSKGRKLETDRTNCSSSRDECHQNSISLGRLCTLRQLQTDLQEKQEQIKTLVQINISEKNRERSINRKLNELKREHQEHMSIYFENSPIN